MPIAVGTRVGSFEVIAPLGAGGMGEVYRARDTRSALNVESCVRTRPHDAQTGAWSLALVTSDALAAGVLPGGHSPLTRM
jgi:hypothetical protein